MSCAYCSGVMNPIFFGDDEEVRRVLSISGEGVLESSFIDKVTKRGHFSRVAVNYCPICGRMFEPAVEDILGGEGTDD